jgi:hypothetical protein
MLVHEYLRWISKPTIDEIDKYDDDLAQRIFRNSWAEISEYLSFAPRKPETNLLNFK